MIDLGFDKLAIISAVALVVIGPEKLPRVARTVGHFLGKAQRYVAQVKDEVNRSIELEELKKMKETVAQASQDINRSIAQTGAEIMGTDLPVGIDAGSNPAYNYHEGFIPRVNLPRRSKKNWRTLRAHIPHWYKCRQGVRTRVQSGAARVARFRP